MVVVIVYDKGKRDGADAAGARKGMSIHRFSEADEIDDANHDMVNFQEPDVIAGFTWISDRRHGRRRHACEAPLLGGRNEFDYVWFKSGFLFPKHHHNADCLYFVMAGELQLGSQTISKGDSFRIPKDSSYRYKTGPQGVEVLEFRDEGRYNLVIDKHSAEEWEKIAASVGDNWRTGRAKLSPVGPDERRERQTLRMRSGSRRGVADAVLPAHLFCSTRRPCDRGVSGDRGRSTEEFVSTPTVPPNWRRRS